MRFRKASISAILSACTTVLIFSYLLRHVSLYEAVAMLRDIYLPGVGVFVLLSLAMSAFRAWRYLLLLNVSGYTPSKLSMFLVVLARNFFSDLLPARLGSLVYIFLVNTRLRVPLAAATSSFSLAFIFDIVALAPLVLIAAIAASAIALPALELVVAALLLLAACAAVLFFLPACFSLAGRLVGVAAPRLSEVLHSTSTEIQKTQGLGIYRRLLLLSLLVRICKYSSLYFLLFALLFPLGYQLQELNPFRIFLGLCAAELSASLPISGIAGFGAYQGAWSVVFELLGFPGQIAKLTSISHHLFTQLYGYSLGALALLLLALPVWRLSPPRPSVKLTRFYPRVAALVCGLSLLSAGILGLQASDKPSADKVAKPKLEQLAASRGLATQIPGEILFDSNRSGSFGIYAVELSSGKVRTIVDTEFHEMYPDASADGRYIVFGRSKGLARRAPSEVWLVDRTGQGQRKLADNGTFPTFSSDGTQVFFERERQKIMSVTLEGSKVQQIFPNEKTQFSEAAVVKPRISANGRFAFFTSDAVSRWDAWYSDLQQGGAARLASGCQPIPFSDNSSVAWVREGGESRDGSGIWRQPLAGGESKPIVDEGPPRGHEYFPTLILQDRFLLYAACPSNQHSHLEANYQLFARELNGGQSVRITFDGFTNRWPKLLVSPK